MFNDTLSCETYLNRILTQEKTTKQDFDTLAINLNIVCL